MIDSDISKTFIVIPTDRDLREIQSNRWEYLNSDWYKEIKNLTKKYNFKFIDLALDSEKPSDDLIITGQNNWYLKCDGHWSEAGHKYAYEKFMLYNETKIK